jgi:hypothetical protein
MKAVLLGIGAAAVVATAALFVGFSTNVPVREMALDASVRLGDQNPNLIGSDWSGRPNRSP